MLLPRRLLALPLIALLGLVALLAAACSGDDAPLASDESTSTSSPSTTGARPTTTTTAAPEPPPTVLVAGDSIIYDVSPVLVAALDPDAARVIPLVAPALSAESNRVSLLATAEESSADVVIVMVGIWERVYVTPAGDRLGDPGWDLAYAAEVLDPVADAVTGNGGRLVLLGPPHIRVPADEAEIAQLERVWAGYAAGHDGVSFVDSDTWLLASDVFAEIDGTERIRRIDGIHLCEEGARRIAAGIIDELSDELDAAGTAPAPGWETGAWTARFPADECPPTT